MKRTTYLVGIALMGLVMAAAGPASEVDQQDNTAVIQAQARGLPSPEVADYGNSGCLPGTRAEYAPCGEDVVEITVDGTSLHTLHQNAMYNCCPDDIVVSLNAQGDVLYLTEDEILSLPCWCMCCYDVEATIVYLPPGTYTVVYCWFDEDTQDDRCHAEAIVIEPPCGDLDGDGSVGLADFATFAVCFGLSGPTAECGFEEFVCSDLDGDGAVGLTDFSTFSVLFGLPVANTLPDCTGG